mgnify:CR=1 FL=1
MMIRDVMVGLVCGMREVAETRGGSYGAGF